MIIKNIVCHAISVPLDEPFYFFQGWVDRRQSLIVEIITGKVHLSDAPGIFIQVDRMCWINSGLIK